MKQFTLPEQVEICEVAPRDGFQAETKWIPTDEKVKIINELAKTGIQSMEITSFVHPKAIPQLKDAEEVVNRTRELSNIQFRALVPNLRGAERAVSVGIKKLKLMLSATDSHSISNANCTVMEAQQNQEKIITFANKENVIVSGSISVAFGCPYEGEVPVEKLILIVDRYAKLGITEISLADTTGMGNPKQVSELLQILKGDYPNMEFSMHFHNTRGLAIANVIAALQQGITKFDSSIAGLGGCPYAPGASGNIATEDLVYALESMHITTGINLDAIIQTAKTTKSIIGHDGGSYMLQAGPITTLQNKPTEQNKMEA
ncbi:hydroxymethylglutaryl-CoA lyase [Sporosarcina contaminans]|uniref:Hydroxymethylglutaryl-CoA lyase n=1 Tax=Sporosarcina contaminans TaxID=633403 RepID=A0ABW3TW71_9BACL